MDNEPAAFDLAMPQQFNEEDMDEEMDDDEDEVEEEGDASTHQNSAVNDLAPSNLDALRNNAGVMV